MKSLPPITFKQKYANLIQKKIEGFFDDVLFNYLGSEISESLYNADLTEVEKALKSGKLYYSNGLFTGKFNNKLSKELEDMGGIYSKSCKGYKVELHRIPVNVQSLIATSSIEEEKRIKNALGYLADLEGQLNWIYNKLDFTDEFKTISTDLGVQFQRTLKPLHIIPYELTNFQRIEISKNYTNNLDFYIKKWTGEEISKLRTGLQDLITQGATPKSLEKYILEQKAVGQRKAKFLARQEMKLFVSEYQKNRYKEYGITQFKWSTIMDGRERELHKEYNGKIFYFDSPPIVDDRTGEHGIPGSAFGCRCKAIPLVTEQFWENRRRVAE